MEGGGREGYITINSCIAPIYTSQHLKVRATMTNQPNSVYLPLDNALRVSVQLSRPNTEDSYDTTKQQTDSFLRVNRGFEPVTGEERTRLLTPS